MFIHKLTQKQKNAKDRQKENDNFVLDNTFGHLYERIALLTPRGFE